MQRAIAVELRELGNRLLAIVFKTEEKFGGLDRGLVQWMSPLVEKYEGPNPKEGMSGALAKLREVSDEQLAEYCARKKAEALPSLFYPQLDAPYLKAAVADLREFQPDYSQRILDILANLQILSDIRSNVLYYQRLTFTPGVTPENHENAIYLAAEGSKEHSKRAKIIVDKIAALEQGYPASLAR